MRALGELSIAAIVAGGALVVDAVIRGRASVAWVVIVPVISGGSAEFLAGVALLIVGLFLLPFVFAPALEPPTGPASPKTRPTGTSAAGGLVLVGPVPLLFGSFRDLSRRDRWLLTLAGAAILVVLLLVGFFAPP